MRSYVTTFAEDEDGNPILEIPDELLEVMDWKEGDELEFIPIGNSLRISKVEGGTSDS